MVNNPINPLDNFNIFQEVKQTDKTPNTTVHSFEQKMETFKSISFSDAVKELDDLFQSG
ncbi:MAG: hypothetical protein ACW964_13630 [Candidatus Hodarchaeales archaeon]|jgi:hypothetical protein